MIGFAQQLFQGLVRTVIPAIVAAIASWLLAHGIDPGPYKELITTIVAGLIGGAYWAVVRLLEQYVSPHFGWLLGKRGAPVYPSVDGG